MSRQGVDASTTFSRRTQIMRFKPLFQSSTQQSDRDGNMKWGLIALLLGLPIPVVLLATLFMGGCN
jgi:hypothetical protein